VGGGRRGRGSIGTGRDDVCGVGPLAAASSLAATTVLENAEHETERDDSCRRSWCGVTCRSRSGRARCCLPFPPARGRSRIAHQLAAEGLARPAARQQGAVRRAGDQKRDTCSTLEDRELRHRRRAADRRSRWGGDLGLAVVPARSVASTSRPPGARYRGPLVWFEAKAPKGGVRRSRSGARRRTISGGAEVVTPTSRGGRPRTSRSLTSW